MCCHWCPAHGHLSGVNKGGASALHLPCLAIDKQYPPGDVHVEAIYYYILYIYIHTYFVELTKQIMYDLTLDIVEGE